MKVRMTGVEFDENHEFAEDERTIDDVVVLPANYAFSSDTNHKWSIVTGNIERPIHAYTFDSKESALAWFNNEFVPSRKTNE